MFLKLMTQDEGVIVAAVTRDVQTENLDAFKAEIYGLTGRVGADISLNFSGVETLCSRALGVLAVAAWRLQRNAGTLSITNLNANLYRLFRIARLDRSMTVAAARTARETPAEAAA